MKFSVESISQLGQLLSASRRIVIVSHRNPDGDALGSSLGWMFFLRKLGHDAFYISPNDYTKNLSWIPGTDEILVNEGEIGRKLCESKIKNAEIIFCLDFNAISRLEDLGKQISEASGVKVMIDHHQQPEGFAAISFSDTSYCATSEMVYDIISDIGHADKVDENIATCLYTGLATDNGFFQFSNTTPNALLVGAALIQAGAKPAYISEKVFNIFKENRLRFFGFCLHEKLKLVKNGKVAYMMLSMAEIKKFNLQGGDSEGLVNYPFKIEGVRMTAYFSEEPDKIKISFRSQGNIDVNTFARTYFEGGGHFNAAGGKSGIGLDKTEKKFLEALESINF